MIEANQAQKSPEVRTLRADEKFKRERVAFKIPVPPTLSQEEYERMYDSDMSLPGLDTEIRDKREAERALDEEYQERRLDALYRDF
ncbi:MAG: hypothetical protein A2W22_04860 [Candidatus Levybacteria bacterium RBG_16_35_11]|nr:MAG: hypothetical protein A2W22_04860 [Candidatus Levybacteria bacterium RBG_16_35_11]